MASIIPDPEELRGSIRYKVPFAEERAAIPVFLDDWAALIKSIRLCKISVRPWEIFYSASLAVGVTALLSIAPIVLSGLPGWVLTIYIVIAALGLTTGTLCIAFGRVLAGVQHSRIDDVVDDMNRLAQPFTEAN